MALIWHRIFATPYSGAVKQNPNVDTPARQGFSLHDPAHDRREQGMLTPSSSREPCFSAVLGGHALERRSAASLVLERRHRMG